MEPIEKEPSIWVKKPIELATLLGVGINIIVLFVTTYISTVEDYKKKFWEEKMQTYLAITDVAGKLTSYYSDTLKMQTLKMEFNSLYYGKTSIFGDKKVDDNMTAFKKSLDNFYPDGATRCNNGYKAEINANTIKLAKACREALKSN